MTHSEDKIAVIGLGYVGLPLSLEFAKQFFVVGFDINKQRINELNSGLDKTLEVENESLKLVLTTDLNANKGLYITDNFEVLASTNIYIITVPTPTDALNKPVFTHLVKASETVGRAMSKNNIVIYESTVYPGATEDICDFS
jgi:UDP-N-acetyl-D-galactosamine dehydrogenase